MNSLAVDVLYHIHVGASHVDAELVEDLAQVDALEGQEMRRVHAPAVLATRRHRRVGHVRQHRVQSVLPAEGSFIRQLRFSSQFEFTQNAIVGFG